MWICIESWHVMFFKVHVSRGKVLCIYLLVDIIVYWGVYHYVRERDGKRGSKGNGRDTR